MVGLYLFEKIAINNCVIRTLKTYGVIARYSDGYNRGWHPCFRVECRGCVDTFSAIVIEGLSWLFNVFPANSIPLSYSKLLG